MTIKKPQYPSLTRRGFIARVAAALSVSPFLFPSLNYAETMKTSTDAVLAAAPATRKAAEDSSIRPFRAEVPQAALDDLRRRLAATRWPDKETVADASQGAQLANLQELVRYWATDYDWRKGEAKLNAFPQFTTKIDGVDIHFFHVRSRHPNAMPLIITHGWPGSVFEQIKIIGPLTDPTKYGGRAEDAFDVVIPSLPGYGFSSRATETGWGWSASAVRGTCS
jgi:Epoxide hydrolase N terminus